jgi:LCP family protein required for cell wall assembly
MKKNAPSVDGFIPRRPGSQIGALHDLKNVDEAVQPIDRSLHTGDNDSTELLGVPRRGKEIGRDDITESLRQIDDIDEKPKKTRRRDKNGGADRPRRKVWRIIKWVLISLLVIGALVGGYLVLKVIFASNNIFQGSLLDLVQNQRLKEDENGRSNFLIFGTAEDDEGGEHGGPNLTDSVMVLSVDQDDKNAYMLSLPRDLWVAYEMPDGGVCSVGYQGKLNAQYFCASNDGQDEAAGAAALQEKVSEITGLETQYYIHLNFTAVVDAVDAVGGVDVTIQSEDPRGILDRNFDWKCNYTCYYVNYENGEVAHLDGERALALARARNAAGGYGLPNGNFDREKNQQMIIKALLEKSVSAGTLTNLGAVTGLIDALGNNLRTNIETKEIRTLMDLGQKTKQENIYSLSLVEEGNMLVTTGPYNGQSIVRPVLGILDYSDIIEYVKKNVTATEVTREAAHLTILNGTSTAGVAQAEADKLEEKGFIVDVVDNAPEGAYSRYEVYQLDDDKPASAKELQNFYSLSELRTGTPPVSVVGESDFLIIIGATE